MAHKIDFTTSGRVWWEELNRTTLTSTTTTTSAFTAKKYLRVIIVAVASGGTYTGGLRFNGDTGSTYAQTIFYNSAGTMVVAQLATQTNLQVISSIPSGGTALSSFDIFNVATSNKQLTGSLGQDFGGTAVSSVPGADTFSGKWVNASQVTSITVFRAAGTGTLGTGSEIIVLGHD